MNSFNAFVPFIEAGNNQDILLKKTEFRRKVVELKKYYKESKNVNLEYFKKDFDDENFRSKLEGINKIYEEDKKNRINKFCLLYFRKLSTSFNFKIIR